MYLFSKKAHISNHTTKSAFTSKNSFLLGKEETLEPKFTKIFGISYAVNVYYLRVKSPELRLEKHSITIYLPMAYRKSNNQALLQAILLKMYTKIAENEIENVMEKARHAFGFAPEDYHIQNLQHTLASCDKDTQSIVISPYIVMQDKEIIEYIVFHEFCHLRYKTHTQKFYALLKPFQPHYETIAKRIAHLKY